MRRSGLIDTVAGLGRHDHVCWVFDRPVEFETRARRFLTEGLAAGQRVCYAAGNDSVGVLARSPALRTAVASGAAQLTTVDAIYPAGTVIDPVRQVAAYAEATRSALADGFTGLRVAADATALVATDEQHDAFARYEHLADRYMTGHPFSAMCGFHRTAIGDRRAGELASLHPATNTRLSTFRLHPSPDPRFSAVLSGELDVAAHEALPAALRRVDLPPVGGAVVIDATGVSFIDHRRLYELASVADRAGTSVVLRAGDHRVLHTLVELLDVPGLLVEAS